MIEWLLDIDKELFILIHSKWANSTFDLVLPILREAKTWIPLYLLFAFLIIRKFKLKGLAMVVSVAIAVLIADRFSAGFMKPFFERLRPCHEPSLSEYLRNLIYCGGQYGFVSSHATNHFAIAVLFTQYFKTLSRHQWIHWIFYLWAALICFAQVYVGKHYPGDVVIGGILGVGIGFLVHWLFNKLKFTRAL